jgi:hypothetical protein
MPSNDEAMGLVQVLKALRQIQGALGRQARPIARACGLMEAEFLTLEGEGLIEVTHFAESGPVLDIHRIEKILPKGEAILAANPTESLRMTLQPPQRSIWSRIGEVTGKILWGLIKLAVPIAGALFVAWYVWKRHWH